MRRSAGFTLLEVMIALAILAVALVAISNLNGGAVAMHAWSRRATQATLLLRGKMLDVEDQLRKDGFHDFDDELHGTFDDEGAPGYAWRAEILKPDVQLDPAQMLSLLGMGQNGSGSKGGSGDLSKSAGDLAKSLGGNAQALQGLQTGGAASLLGGPLGGVMQGQATTFIETLKKSVREIRLTVSWQDGKQQREISASQIYVMLPEEVGKDQNPQVAGVPTNGPTGPTGGVQGPGGFPGFSPTGPKP